jgi:beta-phosphoglucomutase-like phosphatase (HAD superfamily)
VASSSNRPLIEAVLDTAGVADAFAVTVSSEEVARGKPAPDVYLEAARRLGMEPARCAAIEDSSNGIRSAHAAGMRVLALPNAHFPPAPDALALADAVLSSPAELTADVVRG